ncbi:MAG: hypothetical protein R2880_04075 [Deinococcales bacterium]
MVKGLRHIIEENMVKAIQKYYRFLGVVVLVFSLISLAQAQLSVAASEVDRRLYEIDQKVNNLYNSYLATTQQRNLAVTDTTPSSS